MKNNLSLFGALLLTASIVFTSCKKDENTGSSTLNVRMTDAPAAYSKVNVEIKEVLVKMNDDSTTSSGWISLKTNTGIFDLLTLQNNRDTLIGSAVIPSGTVKQIRLILGSNNTVEVSGVTYPLTIDRKSVV